MMVMGARWFISPTTHIHQATELTFTGIDWSLKKALGATYCHLKLCITKMAIIPMIELRIFKSCLDLNMQGFTWLNDLAIKEGGHFHMKNAYHAGPRIINMKARVCV